MKLNGPPKFEIRHRMALALEYGSVSVNEMASELGISRTTISNYLHGRTIPRRSDLRVWALRCGVPFEWLLALGEYAEICARSGPIADSLNAAAESVASLPKQKAAKASKPSAAKKSAPRKVVAKR